MLAACWTSWHPVSGTLPIIVKFWVLRWVRTWLDRWMFLQASPTTPGMALLPLGFGVWSMCRNMGKKLVSHKQRWRIQTPIVLCYVSISLGKCWKPLVWCIGGRLHGAVHTILGRDCHFVKPEPTVNPFWQLKVESMEMLSSYILAAPRGQRPFLQSHLATWLVPRPLRSQRILLGRGNGALCTNVPMACPLKSCTKWLCTYALHSHMQAAHPIMAPPYFIVGEEERAAVVKCFGTGRRGQPAMHKETEIPIPTV